MVGSLPDTFVVRADSTVQTDDDPPDLAGHTLLGRIEAGGMGVVWRFRQLEFDRHLAVKVMKAGMERHPDAIRRFLNEARITGQLAHPSIVPVYAKGQLTDGRLYYSMKLVEGETLAAILDARPGPLSQQAKVLRIFVQVCQAIAYAHQRGVIHRDLKPSNVMVGAFGEVQVMDWGLAKILSEPEEDASSTARGAAGGGPADLSDTRPEPGQDTRPGEVIGTPPYMPPEQARGQIRLLDQRCDLFSLGAILCEILTGDPPYRSLRRDEMVRQAAFGDLDDAFARLDSCGASAELVQLAKACLNPNQHERQSDAGAVAQVIVTYQADVEERLRREGVERAKAEVRASEERKRGRLAYGLAGVVTVGLIGLAAGMAVLGRKNNELVTTNEDLVRAREEAVTKRDRAEWARGRTVDVLDSMTSNVTGESLETQPGITAEQEKFLAVVLNYYKEFAAEEGDDESSRARRAAAAARVGMINYRLGFHQAGFRAFEQARDDFESLVRDFREVPLYQRELADTHSNLGILLRELGKPTAAEDAFRRALALREKLADRYPEVLRYRRILAGSYHNLGLLLEELPKRAGEADQAHRKALTLREQLVEEDFDRREYRRDLAAGYDCMGNLYQRASDWAEAEKACRKALAIREKLMKEFGDLAESRQDLAASHYNLGNLLRKRGDPAEAEEPYRQALALRAKLASDYPAVPRYRQDLAISYHNLSLLLELLKKHPEEEEECTQRALDLRAAIAAQYPLFPDHRWDLAHSYNRRGTMFRKRGKLPQAEAAYREALSILDKLTAEYRDRCPYRRDQAAICGNLARLHQDRKNWPDAEEMYRKALALHKELADELRDPESRYALAGDHFSLANMLDELPGRTSEAKAAYLQARDFWEGVKDRYSGEREYLQNLAGTYNNLGKILHEAGDQREATEAYRRAVATLGKLESDPSIAPELRLTCVKCLLNFANRLCDGGDVPAEALASYDKAIALLKPADDRWLRRLAHWRRAASLDQLGRPDDASADWKLAIALSPTSKERVFIRLTRAHTRARFGPVELALAEAGELAQSRDLDGTSLYNLACVYALASEKDEANREDHIRNALRLLQRSLTRGFKEAELFATDDDLKPLRDRAEYRKMVNQLNQPTGGTEGRRQR